MCYFFQVQGIVAISPTESKWGRRDVGTYKTSDFRKGLRVQIDGEPYQMIEMNFVKPGKGNAFYKCKLRNLVRGTTLDRTYKGGDSLEEADVEEIEKSNRILKVLTKVAETLIAVRPVEEVLRTGRSVTTEHQHVNEKGQVIPVEVIAAPLLAVLRRRMKERLDTVVGALWAVGMSIGILLIKITPGYHTELMSYLFGNISFVTRRDLVFLAVLSTVVVATAAIFHRRFLALCLDGEYAELRGIPVLATDVILFLLIAATVIVLTQIVGVDEEGEQTAVVTGVPDPKKGERLVVLYRSIEIATDEICRKLGEAGLPPIWIPAPDSFYRIDQIPVVGQVAGDDGCLYR